MLGLEVTSPRIRDIRTLLKERQLVCSFANIITADFPALVLADDNAVRYCHRRQIPLLGYLINCHSHIVLL